MEMRMNLSNVLGTVSLIVSIDNSITLESIRAESEKEAIRRLIIDEMRKLIFRLKQTAEMVMMEGNTNHKLAAAAMRILENQLNDSRISPDTFRELSDKEYAYATIRSIREQSSLLFAQLSADEQSEVNEMVATNKRLADYDFYLTHYSNQLCLQEAQEIVDAYQDRNGCMVQILIVLCVLIVPTLIASLFYAAGMGFAMVIWSISIFGISYGLSRWSHSRAFAAAKKTMNEMSDELVWRERFMRLHRRFGSDSKVLALQKADKSMMRAFFGNSNLLPG
jgi:hypothetical protein